MMSSDTGADYGREDIKDTADRLGREAATASRETADRLRQQAGQAVHQAGEQARAVADDEKRAVAGEVHHVAEALRRSAAHFKDEDQPTLAGYVQQAADSLDSFSRNLGERSLDAMVTDLERFARRQPGVFLGGAVATGFLVTRFLKASAERRHAQEAAAYRSGGEALAPSQRSEPPRDYWPGHAEYPPHDIGPESGPAESRTLGQRHPPGATLGEPPSASRPYPGHGPDPAARPRPEPGAGPRINQPKMPGGV